MTILFDRGLVLAKIETTFDVDPTPDNTNDAFLVIEPDYTPDITSLTRDNVRTTMSNDAPITGRKIGSMTFRHEVRSNGNLIASVPPRLGVLLRACAMAETQNLTGVLKNFNASAGSDSLTFTYSANANLYMVRRIRAEITTGGQSGVAIINFIGAAVSDQDEIRLADTDEVTLVDGVPIPVHDVNGVELFTVTPTFGTDDPVTGDVFTFDAVPISYCYEPISDNHESITLYMYLPDSSGVSLLHKLTGGRGTYTMEAAANGFASFSFTFTGSFVTVVDIATPSGTVFETQKPRQVEQAAFSLDDDTLPIAPLCLSQFTIDIANDVQPRECINKANSYEGSIIVGRDPVMGGDPEAVLEATHPFWANLENAAKVDFRAKVGVAKGNSVIFHGPHSVYSGLGYSNRNSIRSYDLTAALAINEDISADGDNELLICFA